MKKIQLTSAAISKDGFGFIWIQVKPDHLINSNNMEEITSAILELSDGTPHPFILDCRDATEPPITPEAAMYYSSHDGLLQIHLSMAMLLKPRQHASMYGIFSCLQQNPTIFYSEEEAKLHLFEEQLKYTQAS